MERGLIPVPPAVLFGLLYVGVASLVGLFLGSNGRTLFGEPFQIQWVLLALRLNAEAAVTVKVASLLLCGAVVLHLWVSWRGSSRAPVMSLAYLFTALLVAGVHYSVVRFLQAVPDFVLTPIG